MRRPLKPPRRARPRAMSHALLFDIDDTLTTARQADRARPMRRSRRCSAPASVPSPSPAAPAGWCDHIARMWPVDAVVGENGALLLLVQRRQAAPRYHDDAADVRARNRAAPGRDRRGRSSPRCRAARSPPTSAYRETDLAIDYCEDVPPLPLEAAERIAALMRRAGPARARSARSTSTAGSATTTSWR